MNPTLDKTIDTLSGAIEDLRQASATATAVECLVLERLISGLVACRREAANLLSARKADQMDKL